MTLLEACAAKGYKYGLSHLSGIYCLGLGVPQDAKRGLTFQREAAVAGHFRTALHLAQHPQSPDDRKYLPQCTTAAVPRRLEKRYAERVLQPELSALPNGILRLIA